jgi:hypothetical protein
MRMRFLGTLLVCAVLAASLLSASGRSHAAAASRCASSVGSLAAIRCAGIRPVAALQPAQTRRQWRRLVRSRRTKVFATAPDCRSLRAVFYAASDWLRLATRLAANASPCAQYYISIPPLAADKTAFRTDQAWRIRALGPNFHALAEIHVGGWRSWVSTNNSTWYQAGVEARRRMAAAHFDVTLGDSWIVNEFPSTVTSGVGPARANMRELVHGLYDGDGGPPTKGGVFDIGVGQGTRDLSTYKGQLEAWLQDGAFWSDMSRYVSDWSQELYGDPRNDDVAGAPLATRRDYLTDYLRHQLVHVRLGGDATAAARQFLESADSPLANAAWQWDYGFGWTMVTADQMKGYVSAQVYALRHFSAEDGEPGDHWGFAWAPHNATSMSASDFASQTGEILDRLAAAIHDTGPVDPADPGIRACGPPGQDLWCEDDLADAWLNDAWKTFTYWGRLALAFATPPQTLSAGSSSAAMTVGTTLAGAGHTTPAALDVTLSSSSSAGRFSTSPGGPWAGTLTVTIPAGADTSPAFYYEDTQAGNPVLTASATGTDSGSQTETVVAGPVATLAVSPGSASLGPGASQQFVAGGADAYGNPVSVDSATWSVAPATLGTLSPDKGGSTTFTAGQAGGQGSITAGLGGASASASVTVVVPTVASSPPPPPPPAAPLKPPVECVVPALRGKTLRAARRALAHRHCALGARRWAHSRKVRRGRVLSQRPRPGAHRPRGARVNVTLSSGRRRRR